MANPLKSAAPFGGIEGQMEPGEVRVINVKDPKTGEITKTITLHRTDRPYVYDLCDAYNDAVSLDARRRGLAWYVTSSGELKLGDDTEWTRQHTLTLERRAENERQQWLRNNEWNI